VRHIARRRRTTLEEFLRCQRLTLQLKCEGLGAAQLAQPAVEPSTLPRRGAPHQAVVDEAWAAWRDEVGFAERFTRDNALDFVGQDGAGTPVWLRETS